MIDRTKLAHLDTFQEYEGSECGEEIENILRVIRYLENHPDYEKYIDVANKLVDLCVEDVLWCVIHIGETCGLPEKELAYWRSLCGD